VQNFISIGACWGRECGPKIWKKSTFGEGSPHVGEPFVRFLKPSCTIVSNLRWFASQITVSMQRNRASIIYPEIFRAPCRKTMRWIEKNAWHFWRHRRALSPSKVWGRSYKGLQVRKHGVCMFFFVTLRGRRAVRSRVTYYEQVLCCGSWVKSINLSLPIQYDDVTINSTWPPFCKSLYPYFIRESSEYDEIWYTDANFNPVDGHVTKLQKISNSRWRTDAILKTSLARTRLHIVRLRRNFILMGEYADAL